VAVVEQKRSLLVAVAKLKNSCPRTANSLGKSLRTKQEKVKEAIEVFKLNVEAYPESFNVYDSLGEAYMVNGDKDLAIQTIRSQ